MPKTKNNIIKLKKDKHKTVDNTLINNKIKLTEILNNSNNVQSKITHNEQYIDNITNKLSFGKVNCQQISQLLLPILEINNINK